MPTAAPRTPAALRRPRRPRGAVTWVTLLFVAALASAVYLAWVWVPVFALEYDVRQTVRDFGNQAVKNREDTALVSALAGRLRGLGQATVLGDDGKPVRKPIVDVPPGDITWERTTPDSLHVTFSWTRTVELPFLDRQVERTQDIDMNLDTTRADWGEAAR